MTFVTFINILTIAGLVIIATGIIQFLFPPKYKSTLFGLRTRLTLINPDTWFYGQRIFSLLMLLFGAIMTVAGLVNYTESLRWFAPFAFISFWFLSRVFTDKIILRKFPDLK